MRFSSITVHEGRYTIRRDNFGNYEIYPSGDRSGGVYLQGEDSVLGFEASLDGYERAGMSPDSACAEYFPPQPPKQGE